MDPSPVDVIEAPDDAGKYADALVAILGRIPLQWGRYISCGPGWYPILAALDAELSLIDPDYEIQQVKEKFGGLRYYASLSPRDDESDRDANDDPRRVPFRAAIAWAERESFRTCEITGAPGVVMRKGGWIRTLDPLTAPEGFAFSAGPGGVPHNITFAADDPDKLRTAALSWAEYAHHLATVLERTLGALPPRSDA